MNKADAEHVEAAESGKAHEVPSVVESLTAEHREYLLRRHGTSDLSTFPSMDDADPYNWPEWKKILNLAFVAFHAMMATFTAAAIQCAFVEITKDLNVTVQRASYLTSLVIAIISCANSPSYATMGLCRGITGFSVCPGATIGSGVVHDMFFKRDCARYMGVWTLMVTLGVPSTPFIFEFVVTKVRYRWIYWSLAIVNGVQTVLYFFFGAETLYTGARDEQRKAKQPSFRDSVTIKRLDPRPLTLAEFVRPLSLAMRPCVLLPSIAYAMVFLCASILIAIEIPEIFPEKFGLDAEQLGLQNLAMIIYSGIGELIGGRMSDRWMWYQQKMTKENEESGKAPAPEYRLWLSYAGIAFVIAGVVVFLVQTESASEHWNVTPLIGAAIAASGNQIVTTVNITYAVDCYPADEAATGVFVNFVRQTWGFIGPFWFPKLLTAVGFNTANRVIIALVVGVSAQEETICVVPMIE
ncbi:major facilitator superfamily domain-containing protein [Aspergillus insuetus]